MIKEWIECSRRAQGINGVKGPTAQSSRRGDRADSGQGTFGQTLKFDSGWTNYGTLTCSGSCHLYCVEE